MNTIGKLLSIALLAGCSSTPVSQTASVNVTPDAPIAVNLPNWGVTPKVRFFNDARPVDGDLNEIDFELSNGTYSASQHIKHGGHRPDPQPVDIDTLLANRLNCSNQFADEIGTLTGVACRFDARPVDGSLTEIIASLEDDNFSYKLTLIVTPSGFGTGNTDPIVTELGSNLTLEIGQNSLPAKIECIEKKTFADAPGYASLLTLDEQNSTASVARQAVRMRGQDQQPWILDENTYLLKTSILADGTLSLNLRADVNTKVDWSKVDSCYRFFPINTYSIQLNEFGKWVGNSQLLPVIKTNPDVQDCSFPHLVRPMPEQIVCHVVE